MKRSTASWTTAIAAAALLAMPVGSWAQQTSPASSQTTSRPAGAQSSANEDLRKAEAALNDIPAASLTGTAKGRVAELKRHITALQRTSSAGTSAPASAGKTSASTELAAADRILTELLGGEGTTGAPEPGAAGTSGKTTPKAAPGLDPAATGKLEEVRTHLTAFAASMGGGTPSPSADDPSAGASAAAAAAAASPSTPSASPSTPSPAPSASSTTTSPSPAATPTPSEPSPASTPAQTPPAQTQAAQQPPAGAQSVDTDAVKQHLTAARESLSQMTQLPAAAQLAGDARTQVSQLISNFNELISTNTDWRASYAKVQANLNTLVGEQRADESPAPAATPAPGAGGAVGTSGTTAIDPAIKAKLVEFRTHLMEFEKAAGGASASASPAASPTAPAEPAAAAAAAAQPSPEPSTPATPPSEPAASPAPTTPAEPSRVGTSGRRAAPTPAGTTGSTASPSAEPSAQSSAPQSAGQSDVMRHVEAIEAILNGSATGTSGSAASKGQSGASTLNREQIEQIKEHLAALRKALNQSSK